MPLLPVPNVTLYTSAASVPIHQSSYYCIMNSSLLSEFNVPVTGLRQLLVQHTGYNFIQFYKHDLRDNNGRCLKILISNFQALLYVFLSKIFFIKSFRHLIAAFLKAGSIGSRWLTLASGDCGQTAAHTWRESYI